MKSAALTRISPPALTAADAHQLRRALFHRENQGESATTLLVRLSPLHAQSTPHSRSPSQSRLLPMCTHPTACSRGCTPKLGATCSTVGWEEASSGEGLRRHFARALAEALMPERPRRHSCPSTRGGTCARAQQRPLIRHPKTTDSWHNHGGRWLLEHQPKQSWQPLDAQPRSHLV